MWALSRLVYEYSNTFLKRLVKKSALLRVEEKKTVSKDSLNPLNPGYCALWQWVPNWFGSCLRNSDKNVLAFCSRGIEFEKRENLLIGKVVRNCNGLQKETPSNSFLLQILLSPLYRLSAALY